MEDKKRVVERVPVEVFLERSLDGQKASIVFRSEAGGEYILVQDGGDFDLQLYKPLSVEEITEPNN